MLFEPLSGDPFFVPTAAKEEGAKAAVGNDARGKVEAKKGNKGEEDDVIEVPFTRYKVDELSDNAARNTLIRLGLATAREIFGAEALLEGNSEEQHNNQTRAGNTHDHHDDSAIPVWARSGWEAAQPCSDFVQHPGETVFVPVRCCVHA